MADTPEVVHPSQTSHKKNQTHAVAVDLSSTIYHAVLALRSHKWSQVAGQEGQLSFLLATFLGVEAGAGQVFVVIISEESSPSWGENVNSIL